MNEKLISFIEESFLKPLLEFKEITDISYNGVNIFYVDNMKGRMKSEIKVSTNEALDFIRQIANFSEKQFSFTNPVLDVSIGKYRINAVHPSLVRVKDDKSCSFAIRISSESNHIEEDNDFISAEALNHLLNCLAKKQSIVIAGPTGSGKTELQKFLLSKLSPNSRVIIIDNIQELEYLRQFDDLDITSWQISSTNPLGSMQELIKNALRSNPDWLVIAESRGEEMSDLLNSVMTGHPIVTTLHAEKIEDIPNRICRMIEMARVNQKHEDILNDVKTHFKNYIFLNRSYLSNKNVERYVESIAQFDENNNFNIIYRRKTT